MGRRRPTGLLALLAIFLVGAGSSSAIASWSPRTLFSIDSAWLVVDPVDGDYPSLDLSLSFADGPSPARLVLYAPTGFELYPDRPAGSPIGQATAFAADESFGAGGAALLSGQIVGGENTPDRAPACGQGTRIALWHLRLSLLGQPLDVPIAISPAGPDAPPGAGLELELCLPPLPAANGALLPVKQLRLSLEGLEPPSARGSYLWRALVTPVAPDRRTALADKTYELRAVVPVPHLLSLRGSYVRKSHTAVLHGRLTASGQARPRVRVYFVRLLRLVTPRGVVFRDSVVGSVLTNAAGSFTFRTRLRRTAGFVAVVRDRLGRCDGAAAAPAGCVSASTTGTESDPITIAARARG